MPTKISPLSDVDPNAVIGQDVEIGPFCVVGPNVVLGDRCELQSHVVLAGHMTVGEENRFFAGSVIGGEPQDIGYTGAPTEVIIGDRNIFREGVTINRGAEKEDGVTRIGNDNMLMANSHVAHNCRLYNKVILVNGVLLGGHVHVHDGAIISGNSAVHHFATVGTLSFISGLSRATRDVPPFMLLSGNDDPTIRTINTVGMQRAGISKDAIAAVRRAFRLIYREHKKLDEARNILHEELDGYLPIELSTLFNAIELSSKGKVGRGREALRNQKPDTDSGQSQRKAA